MKKRTLVLGLLPIVLAALFLSVSTYRIVGTNSHTIFLCGIVLSSGTLLMSIELSKLLVDRRLILNRTPVLMGATIVFTLVFSVYWISQINIFNSLWLLLMILLLVAGLSSWIGSRTTGGLLEGFFHGFVMGGISGVVCSIFFSYEAITRDLAFNVLVAIFSIATPLLVGVIGAVFGLLGKLAVDR